MQVVTDADGRPVWVSPVEPGCTHKLTAGRLHALPALYRAARAGVPTLADKACTGAEAGICVPVRRTAGGHVVDLGTRNWNRYVNAERAFIEHGITHLETGWRALRRVSLCPWRISAIVAAPLVLSRLKNRY